MSVKRESQLDYLLTYFFFLDYDENRSRVRGLSISGETIESRAVEMGVNHKKTGNAWVSHKETIVITPITPEYLRPGDITAVNNSLAGMEIRAQEYYRNRYKEMLCEGGVRLLKLKEIQSRMDYTCPKTFYNHRTKWDEILTKRLNKLGYLLS